MKIKDLSMYGSHIPLLVRAIERTDGIMLDLGMGLSTIVMHMMAKKKNRLIVSYETDREWYEANKIYQSDFHEINFVETWEDADIEKRHWSIALVDHAPAKRRKNEIMRLKNNADVILIHDSEPESDKYFKYSWCYKHFKYRYDYTDCRPNTTALSNFVDVKSLLT